MTTTTTLSLMIKTGNIAHNGTKYVSVVAGVHILAFSCTKFIFNFVINIYNVFGSSKSSLRIQDKIYMFVID